MNSVPKLPNIPHGVRYLCNTYFIPANRGEYKTIKEQLDKDARLIAITETTWCEPKAAPLIRAAGVYVPPPKTESTIPAETK